MPSSRFFAFLLGGAALSLVLSTSARAEVLIDQQQLTGQGKTVAQQVYGDVHQRPSPFGQAAVATILPDEPVVITSKGYGAQNSIANSDAKEPIALKPLPKWGMAAPAQPISTGERSAILLRPPSAARDVIHQLAQQSPLRSDAQQTADNSPLRLRPPAPIPPAPQFAQMQQMPVPAQYAAAPLPNTQVMAPMPQAVAMAPPPTTTAIAAPVAPAAAPQTQVQVAMNTAPVAAAAVPVSQMGQLRAEDVVALDFGSSESGKPVEEKKAPEAQPVANVPPAAPVEEKVPDDVLPDVPAFMPPLEDEQAAPVKTSEAPAAAKAASVEPQFISPLTEGLPTDEDSGENKTSTLAMVAPSSPAPEIKSEEPKTDAVKTADAPPASEENTPSFISAFDDAVSTAPNAAESTAETIVAAAPKAEHVLPNIPAAPKAEPVGEPKLADANKLEKAAAVGETHASADHAADAVVQSLKEPEASKENFAAATAETKPQQIAANDIDWNADAKPVVDAAAEKAKAEEAEKIKLAEAEQAKVAAEAEAKAKIEAELKAKAEADAKAQAEAEALIRKQQEEIAQAKAEAEAKAKAEADRLAQIQAEELARQQQEEIARIKAEAEAKAKAEAEQLAKAQAEEMARQQEAELAQAKAEAQAQAKAEAEQLAKVQAEERAKAQAAAIEKAKAEALAQAKAEMEAKAQAEAEAKIAADKKAADDAIAERARQQLAAAREKLNAEMPAVPTTPVERVSIMEEPEKIKTNGVETASLNAGAVSDAVVSAEAAPLVQQTVLFQSGMSVLPSNANAVVKDLAQQAKNSRDAKIILSAYADGSSQASSSARRLSLQRAMLMRDALNKMGIAISRVEVRAQTAAPGDANPDRVDITLQ